MLTPTPETPTGRSEPGSRHAVGLASPVPVASAGGGQVQKHGSTQIKVPQTEMHRSPGSAHVPVGQRAPDDSTPLAHVPGPEFAAPTQAHEPVEPHGAGLPRKLSQVVALVVQALGSGGGGGGLFPPPLPPRLRLRFLRFLASVSASPSTASGPPSSSPRAPRRDESDDRVAEEIVEAGVVHG